MPEPPKLYYLARLWIDLTRQLHETVAPDKQLRFGSRAGLLLIGTAVYVGTIEGRPMTATKLAAYVGIPRVTVMRQLRTLCRRGAVERRGHTWCTPAKRLERFAQDDLSTLTKTVRAVADRLKREADADKP